MSIKSKTSTTLELLGLFEKMTLPNIFKYYLTQKSGDPHKKTGLSSLEISFVKGHSERLSVLDVNDEMGCWKDAQLPYTIPRGALVNEAGDVLVFYLPFHHHSEKEWGIYIVKENAMLLADRISSEAGISLEKAFVYTKEFLYRYGAFQHSIESAALNFEIFRREKVYSVIFSEIYSSTKGNENCFDEVVGTAYGLFKLAEFRVNRMRTPKPVQDAFIKFVHSCPEGFRHGASLATRKEIESRQNDYAEHAYAYPGDPVNPSVWRSCTHLFRGLGNIRSDIRYLV